jgi:hypothetical protein
VNFTQSFSPYFCPKPRIKNSLVAALIADGLTAALPIPTATLAAITILVGERYLDNLCVECAKELIAMTDEALKKRIHSEIANATVKILVADEFQSTGFFITPDGYALTAYQSIGEEPYMRQLKR